MQAPEDLTISIPQPDSLASENNLPAEDQRDFGQILEEWFSTPRPLPDKIKEVITLRFQEPLSPELMRVLDRVDVFSTVLPRRFEEEFRELLDKYQNKRGPFSDKLKKFLQEKGLLAPQLETLFDNKQIQEKLKQLGFQKYVPRKDKPVVIFNLPKPLAQFWWKGGVKDWGVEGQHVKGELTEWGDFYRELMKTVWMHVGYATSEMHLSFKRINGNGEHEPLQYYYIWEMGHNPPEGSKKLGPPEYTPDL